MTPRADRADRGAGALLGTLIGDALGAPYEGSATAASWAAGGDRLDRALRGPRRFTDDTQMAIALGLHLLEHSEVDEAALGRTFVDHFEPWRGYGPGTIRVLDALSRGVPPAEAARTGFPDGSLGNGAAMRAAGVGARWAADRQVCAEAARRSARPTHVHPEGVDGAVAIAAAVAAAIRTDDELVAALDVVTTTRMRDVLSTARDLPSDVGPHEVVNQLGHDATAVGSVPTALWIATRARSPEDVLARALAIGGDADTIAAMSLAVVGAARGAQAFPPAWAAVIDEPTWGPDAVADLGERLAAAA